MERSVTATFAEELRPRFARIQHAQVQAYTFTRETKLPGLEMEIERAVLCVNRAIFFALRMAPLPRKEMGIGSPLFLRLYALAPITDAKSALAAHEAIEMYLEAPMVEHVGYWLAGEEARKDPDQALAWASDAALNLGRGLALARARDLVPLRQRQARATLNVAAGWAGRSVKHARVPFASILDLLAEMRGVGKPTPSVSAPGFN
jgi:hypothetical protein